MTAEHPAAVTAPAQVPGGGGTPVRGHVRGAEAILLSGTSGLSGVVRAAGAGSAVQDAMVVVSDVRGDVLASGVTGEQGEFGFGELVPGEAG